MVKIPILFLLTTLLISAGSGFCDLFRMASTASLTSAQQKWYNIYTQEYRLFNNIA